MVIARGDIVPFLKAVLLISVPLTHANIAIADLILTTTPEKAQVKITWTAAPGNGPYVYKLEKLGINGTPVYQHTIGTYIGSGTHIDTLVSNADSYAYRVTAAGQTAPFEWHQTAWIPGRTFLKAPSVAFIEDLGASNLKLTWNPSNWADEYRIYTGINSPTTLETIVPAGTNHLNLGFVNPNTRANRIYAVYPKNAAGFGPISPWASLDGVTTAPVDPSLKPPFESTSPLYPAAPINRFNPKFGGTVPPGETGIGPLDSGDPINLASGHEEYNPAPDLTAYNPNGIPAVFQRIYKGAAAFTQSTPSTGLSTGWFHNYDVKILRSTHLNSWEPLKLVYPGGSTETLTPLLSGNSPNGQFQVKSGSPYFVSGTPSPTPGKWQFLNITFANQTVWRFEPSNDNTLNLVSITNQYGQGITLNWGPSLQLLDVRDCSSNNLLLSLIYNSELQLTSVTDNTNRRVHYIYGSSETGNLGGEFLTGHSIIVPDSQPAQDSLIQTKYDYTNVGGKALLAKVSKPLPANSGDSTLTLEYQWLSNLNRYGITKLTDANQNKTEFTYSNQETLVQIKSPTNQAVHAFTQCFDSNLRDSGIKNALGHRWIIQYQDQNNPSKPTSVSTPSGISESLSYDQFGNLLTHTNAIGITTTNSYDYTFFPLGRLIQSQHGSRPPTTWTYQEPTGNLTSVTSGSPTGSGTITSTYTYDSLGNLTSHSSPGTYPGQKHTTTFNYSTDGGFSTSPRAAQPLVITDPAGITTHYRYDARGNIQKAWSHGGTTTNYYYNIANQLTLTHLPPATFPGTRNAITLTYQFPGGPAIKTETLDFNQQVVSTSTIQYGAEGEILGSGDTLSPNTFQYDAAYRTIAKSDAMGRTTTYTYNSIGLPATITLPIGSTTQYTTYNSDSRPTSMISANGQVINTSYNSNGQITAVTHPGNPQHDYTHTYSPYGQIQTITDSAGSRTYSYGNIGQTLSLATTFPTISTKTITYIYNQNGSAHALTTPAGTFQYQYDSAGRIISVTNPNSETTTFGFNWQGWRSEQTLANGCKTEFDHDLHGRLSTLTNKSNLGIIRSQFQILYYDPKNQITQAQTSFPAFPHFSGTQSFSYDQSGQLLSEFSTRFGGYSHNFAYDLAGNLTQLFGNSNSYNSANQLTGNGFNYDPIGDPITYKGTSLSFTPSGNLKTYGTTLSAESHSDGKRAWKDSPVGRKYFLYTGTLPILELNAAGQVNAYNTFGPTGLISRRSGSATSYYQFDPRGSTTHRLSGSGGLLSSHIYDAYGGQTSTTTTSDPWVNFAGQSGYWRDTETNLLLATFRYYDPTLGRWLTPDPIGHAGGQNLYSYVAGNPISSVDPLGTSPWLDWPAKLAELSSKTLGKVGQYEPTPAFLRNPFSPTLSNLVGAGNDLLTLPYRTANLGTATGQDGLWGLLLNDLPIVSEWVGMAGGISRVPVPGEDIPLRLKNGARHALDVLGEPMIMHWDTGVKMLPGRIALFPYYKKVRIMPTGSRRLDEASANYICGFKKTPEGMTWHHSHKYGEMQLVDQELHRKTGHVGGWSIWGKDAARELP